MDASPTVMDAVAALHRAHRSARDALDAERARADPQDIPAGYLRRRIDLHLDTIEEALEALRDLCGASPPHT